MIAVASFQDANETPNVQVQAGVAAFFFLSPLEGSGHPQTGSDVVSFLNILKAEFIILVTFSIWLLFLMEIVLCLASCSLVLLSHVCFFSFPCFNVIVGPLQFLS